MKTFGQWITNLFIIVATVNLADVHAAAGKAGVKAVILYMYDDATVGSSVVSMEVDKTTFMNVIKDSQFNAKAAKPMKFGQENGFFALLEGESSSFSFATSSGIADCDCKCSKQTTTTPFVTTTRPPIVPTTSRQTTYSVDTPPPVITTFRPSTSGRLTSTSTAGPTYLPPTTTSKPCPSGGKGQFCCTNGANNPDCCVNGGKGKYCCLNGKDTPDCGLLRTTPVVISTSTTKPVVTETTTSFRIIVTPSPCPSGGSGPFCCLNGANNKDCCANGGKGKFCCLNGENNLECSTRTTSPPTYLPPQSTTKSTTLPPQCPTGGSGPFCCPNGANNRDCCANGGKGKFCCLNGENNPDCSSKITSRPTGPTYLPPLPTQSTSPPSKCPTGTSGPFCCSNGANNKDCCENGGKGAYCCLNGKDTPDCGLLRTTPVVISTSTTKPILTTTTAPCPTGGSGPFCCPNGADNRDCCANGGKGKFCCLNGENNLECSTRTTSPPTYLPPLSTRSTTPSPICPPGNPDCSSSIISTSTTGSRLSTTTTRPPIVTKTPPIETSTVVSKCPNGGSGTYCCKNGSESPNCETKTTENVPTTRPTPRQTIGTTSKPPFKGPTYLPLPTVVTSPRPSTTDQYTFGTFSTHSYRYNYTIGTWTRDPNRSTTSYTTTPVPLYHNGQPINSIHYNGEDNSV